MVQVAYAYSFHIIQLPLGHESFSELQLSILRCIPACISA